HGTLPVSLSCPSVDGNSQVTCPLPTNPIREINSPVPGSFQSYRSAWNEKAVAPIHHVGPPADGKGSTTVNPFLTIGRRSGRPCGNGCSRTYHKGYGVRPERIWRF